MPNWKLCLAVICIACASHVDAAELDKPWLQLEPGAHWAPARRVAVSPDDRFVATASDDKTVRIWQTNGRLVQVLRPPIGEGSMGRLYGVAFHPNQPLLAVGGTSADATGTSIFLLTHRRGA